MNPINKAANILMDIFIAVIVLVWAYLLYKEFLQLPTGNQWASFSLFNIKILLFSLFLIASVTVVFYINMMEKKSGKSASILRANDQDRIIDELYEIKGMLSGRSQTELLQKPIPDTSNSDILLKKMDSFYRLLSAQSSDALFSEIVRLAPSICGASRVSLFMYHSEKDKLCLIKQSGIQEQGGDPVKEIEIREGISWNTYKSGKRIYATNIETHPEFGKKNQPQYSKKSFMVFPLHILKDQTVGVLNVSEKSNDVAGIFTKTDLELMNFIISLFEIRLENFVLSDSIDELLVK